MTQYKIIIVENDEDEQFFMNESFRKSELFDVIVLLNNGNALMDWLQTNPGNLPDLILSDLNMPGKNGYDIIAEVKENPALAHIPVIITSTSSTKTFIDRCLALGAADYLVKPETFIDYGPYIENLHRIVHNRIAVK
ncbi:response regulator [Paracnuella aquatica]|uniref:response regulator n=1 Tax=Paracnuella aquatica TaxID=2268757 RepID=UPI000DEF8283|nr:response regulator [Paracnuella aquatica]RPD51424.1 response regulator [Paracnuella aquatica]